MRTRQELFKELDIFHKDSSKTFEACGILSDRTMIEILCDIRELLQEERDERRAGKDFNNNREYPNCNCPLGQIHKSCPQHD